VRINETASASNNYSVSNQLNERISVQQRASGYRQVVKDAAVYKVRLIPSMLAKAFLQLRNRTLARLQAHLVVLKANPEVSLILQVRVVPKAKRVDPCIKETARILDLPLLQLGSERSMEITEPLWLVDSVQNNGSGRLVVKKLYPQNSALLTLEV